MALPNPGWHLRDANLRRQPQRGRAPIPPSVVVPHRLEVNRWWKVSGPFELPASWDCGTTQKNVPLTAMDKVLSEYDCLLTFLLSNETKSKFRWYHLITFSSFKYGINPIACLQNFLKQTPFSWIASIFSSLCLECWSPNGEGTNHTFDTDNVKVPRYSWRSLFSK